jgi:DNA-directed RNA polymerase specialized sigma24 family protein
MSEEPSPNLRISDGTGVARKRIADADDVIQQTPLQGFTHRRELRAPSKFKNWIASIAMNEFRGFVRRTR